MWDQLMIAIGEGNEPKALELINTMNTEELSKIDDQAENGPTALSFAAEKGLEQACRLLIVKMDQKAINSVDASGWSALHSAIRNSLTETCKLLIPKMSPEIINSTQTLLSEPIYFRGYQPKNLDTIYELLIPIMDIHIINNLYVNGETILFSAIREGLDKTSKLLIQTMSSNAISSINNNSETVLHLAARNGLEEICESLISKMQVGALHVVNKDNKTALHLAIDKGLDKTSELLALKMNLAPDAALNSMCQAFIEILRKGLDDRCFLILRNMNNKEIEALEKIKEASHANLKEYEWEGTLLHIAIDKRMENTSKLLISKMSQNVLNSVNTNGESALHIAINNRLSETCELLISKMPSKAINSVNGNGNTLLHLAARAGLEETCGLLISIMPSKAINSVNDNGETALHIAAFVGLEETCGLLISKMPSEAINSVNDNGETALHIAAREALWETCGLLISKMSPEAISLTDKNGCTVLFLAAWSGLEQICEQLVSKMSPEAINAKLSIKIPDRPEWTGTVLDIAVERNLEPIRELLLAKMNPEVIKTVNQESTDLSEKKPLESVLRDKEGGGKGETGESEERKNEKSYREEVKIMKIRPEQALREKFKDHPEEDILDSLIYRIKENDRYSDPPYRYYDNHPLIEELYFLIENIQSGAWDYEKAIGYYYEKAVVKLNSRDISSKISVTRLGQRFIKEIAEQVTKETKQKLTEERIMKLGKQPGKVIEPEITAEYIPTINLTDNLFKLEDAEAANNFDQNDQVIKHISELIREGNNRLQTKENKAILILGNTGAGKSTLANTLGGMDLRAIIDEETGELTVDTMKSCDIAIGHKTASETKIPNKCAFNGANNIIIWDCPGFNDTNLVQEIANSFYIKRLFETNDLLRLVLLIPEAHLTENKGYQFIETVSRFMACFSNLPQDISNNISLIISKVASHKKIPQVNNSINKILEQNDKVTSELKELVIKLQNNLGIFYKPKDEGEIKTGELLQNFNLPALNFLESKSYTVNMRVSPQAKEYSSKLLGAAANNFNKILELTVKAIADATKCLNDNPSNIFLNNYNIILNWIPSKIDYKIIEKHDATEHFFNLGHLSALRNTLTANESIGTIEQGIDLLQKALAVFVEYLPKDNIKLKYQIKDYGYVLLQQYQYVRFFSEICEKELPGPQWLTQVIKECYNKVTANLEYQVKTMNIDISSLDSEYYYKAIKYLDSYPNSMTCKSLKAKAYSGLAGIAARKNDNKTALEYFLKAIEFDHESASIYDKVGKLFYDKGEYNKAIKCYKVVNNVLKIKECFKRWLEHDSENPDIMMKRAEYFESAGIFDKAKTYYHNAFSLSSDEKVKAEAWRKIGDILINVPAQAQNYSDRAKVGDFYNYELVDDNFIKELLGETVV